MINSLSLEPTTCPFISSVFSYIRLTIQVAGMLVTQSCLTLCHPLIVAIQTTLSMEFSRQEYWCRYLFPSPGIFLTQGLNLGLLYCRQILLPSKAPKCCSKKNKEV